MKVLILGQSEITCRALTVLLDAKFGVFGDSVSVFALDFEHSNRFAIDIYDELVERIECAIEHHRMLGTSCLTVIVDRVRMSASSESVSLTNERTQWDSAVAMLIIAFPEIRWLFGLVRNNIAEDQVRIESPFPNHSLDFDLDHKSDPLFDPTGIRDWIRAGTNDGLHRMSVRDGNLNTPFQLPRRTQLAAVIEDEPDFALMHGYAAYRFGFRTEVITSWEHMQRQFHVDDPEGQGVPTEARHKYQLILEDMRLQFPDKPADVKLSKPEDRARHCNLLADKNDDSDYRFMISTGQESMTDDLWGLNEAHLANKRYGFGKLLTKPVEGPFALWRKTGLHDFLPDGRARGFVSPPAEIMDDLYSGHGAPGKLALVASTLIDRARRVLASADTPRDFLLAAVLANDAFELLGGKTPTMSFEAIKLKYVSEVRAECAFIGTGFHTDLKDRFKEIKRDVASAARWFQPKQRNKAAWDAQATIYNELVKVYRDVGQMEEEDECLAKFRLFNRKLNRPHLWQLPLVLPWLIHGTLAYAEFLLSDLGRIMLAFIVWSLIFMNLQLFFAPDSGSDNPLFYLARQLNWTIGGGAYDFSGEQAPDTKLAIVTIFANVIGVFHFGVLMSYLYGLISRK